jgi:hypothetical protein
MEIISKQEARDRGLKRYFTGKPCSRGHVAERLLKGHCVECTREDNHRPAAVEARKRYAQTDKGREVQRAAMKRHNATEGRKSWNRQWAASNPDKVKAAQAKYSETHKEVRTKRTIDWRARNADHYRRYMRQWQLDNPEKCVAAAKKRYATARQSAVYLDQEKPFIELMFDMGRELGLHVDHIIPQTHEQVTGLHCLLNLRLLGPAKNMSKGNKFDPDRAHLVSPY